LGNAELRRRIFKTLEEKKLIVPVSVPEIKETFYIRRSDLTSLNEPDRYDGTARFLAPLDNMLWDRTLVKKVFDFEYTWEVYTPKEKRKYGYYVLPVLYKNSLVARFEPFQFREGDSFGINNWWWENKINGKLKGKSEKSSKAVLLEAVISGLKNFAEYLGANGVEKNSLKMIKAAG